MTKIKRSTKYMSTIIDASNPALSTNSIRTEVLTASGSILHEFHATLQSVVTITKHNNKTYRANEQTHFLWFLSNGRQC